MDNQTDRSTDVVCNFRIGDRVIVAVHPLLAGISGEITALPSPDAGIVALDGGTRERISLSCLKSANRLMSNDVPNGTSFNVEVLSSAPMTAEEARATIEQINRLCNQIRALLVELETREGYLALGFNSMAQLMNSNLFVKARSTLQKELLAGRIETQYLHVPVGTFSESHLRPLSKLKPEYYIEVLSQATQSAGDRPMTARDVSAAVATMLLTDKNAAKRSIVDVVKERTYVPLCERSSCRVEDAIVVRAFKNADLRPYDGYWGIVQYIGNNCFHIYISLKGETIQCREEEVEQIDMTDGDGREANRLRHRITLLSVSSRISNLLKADLEAVDYAILETIQRSLYLTPRQLMHLELMEKDYGVSQ
ncbi:MAG: hypothetical protein N4J56_006854 [Chroococcidiopsis sp. SAG 2025]|uniref:hypothetical protein n=1 Tax=Chroococcidiopsis sp. SAG 2025 TaxID=171389 RepID=UPI0029370247|nr:hypothetical protein [Chroococcidiopsis sp. SAG 2025]MDV2997149.1 hypothetical protein [Chroococcidiopsis sp. SAG 2025]